MLVQKLRIYAMILRLQELEQERINEIKQRKMRAFLPEPIIFHNVRELMPKGVFGCDKNGKPFDLPKSKYHK